LAETIELLTGERAFFDESSVLFEYRAQTLTLFPG
jgi:hypothetical protein